MTTCWCRYLASATLTQTTTTKNVSHPNSQQLRTKSKKTTIRNSLYQTNFYFDQFSVTINNISPPGTNSIFKFQFQLIQSSINESTLSPFLPFLPENFVSSHCLLHHEALAPKKVALILDETLQTLVKMIINIKANALTRLSNLLTCLFRKWQWPRQITVARRRQMAFSWQAAGAIVWAAKGVMHLFREFCER